MLTAHRSIAHPRPLHRPMTRDIVPTDHTARQAWRSRFLGLQLTCLDPETFTLADFALWHALEEHICDGGEVLDLSAHGEALGRAPEELMEAFADACRQFQRRAKALHLPAGLAAMPSWVDALPWVEHLTAPGLADAPAAPSA